MPIELSTINLLNARDTIGERLPRLRDELLDLTTDVIALQEVMPDLDAPEDVHRPTQDSLGEAGLQLAAHGHFDGGLTITNAVAYRDEVLTLLEAGSMRFGHFEELRWQTPDAAYAVFEPVGAPGKRFIVISAHFAWGAENTHIRLANAVKVEELAADLNQKYPGALTFLAGDFNEGPTGAALQYLSGSLIVEGRPTFWIDLWTTLRPGEPGYTSIPTSHYASITARSIGIENVELLPKRRIDYILVRGWAYQSLGTDPDIEIWGNAAAGDVSDHLGLSLAFDV